PVTLAWLVTSYLIAMASLQPIAGRLGDRFGRRRFMLGALVYFIVASVGAALAPNLLVLVAFRLQQALAAASVVPYRLPDLRGAITLGVLLSVAAWTLTEAGTSAPAVTVGLLAAVALAAVGFVRYESRHADPALPPFLFTISAFTNANLTIALSNLALYGT